MRTRRIALYGAALLVIAGVGIGLAGCGGQQAQKPEPEEEKAAVTQPQAQPEEPQQPEEAQPTEPPEPPQEEPPKDEQDEDAQQALIEKGKQLAQSYGCLSCHTIDGSPSVGPTWKGLYGAEVELEDGTTVVADEAYIRESIVDPNAKVHKGYPPIMPPYTQLSEDELNALVEYIKSLGGNGGKH